MILPWRGLAEEAHWTVGEGAVRGKKNSNTRLLAKRHYGVHLVRHLEELLPFSSAENVKRQVQNERKPPMYDVGQSWWWQWGESLPLSADEKFCSEMSGWGCSEKECWRGGDFEHVTDQYHPLLCGEVAEIYIHSKSGVYIYATSTHLYVSRKGISKWLLSSQILIPL